MCIQFMTCVFTANLLSVAGASHGGSHENLLAEASSALKRVSSATSISSLSIGSYGNVYSKVYQTLLQLSLDPSPAVAEMSRVLIEHIKRKAMQSALPKPVSVRKTSSSSQSAPSSPSNKPGSHMPTLR